MHVRPSDFFVPHEIPEGDLGILEEGTLAPQGPYEIPEGDLLTPEGGLLSLKGLWLPTCDRRNRRPMYIYIRTYIHIEIQVQRKTLVSLIFLL